MIPSHHRTIAFSRSAVGSETIPARRLRRRLVARRSFCRSRSSKRVGHMPGGFGTVLSAGAYPVEIALVVIAVHLCLYDSGGPDDERVMG